MNPPASDPTKTGILLVNKPRGCTSFSLVGAVRKRLGVKKVGHAGTLDPFATGLVILLVGREYTRLSDQFLLSDKEYIARLKLGISTDSYDCDGKVIGESPLQPTEEELKAALNQFQGEVEQVPPMFSAKKINGQKLYTLARQGKEIERPPVKIRMETTLLHYAYPYADIKVSCSKGTYIRSIAHDLGQLLGCGAHLTELQRTRSGDFLLEESVDGDKISDPHTDISSLLRRAI